MLQFYDDADLVEQERHELQKILSQPSANVKFPFDEKLLLPEINEAVASSACSSGEVTSETLRGQSDSSLENESNTSQHETQSEDLDDREEDDRSSTPPVPLVNYGKNEQSSPAVESKITKKISASNKDRSFPNKKPHGMVNNIAGVNRVGAPADNRFNMAMPLSSDLDPTCFAGMTPFGVPPPGAHPQNAASMASSSGNLSYVPICDFEMLRQWYLAYLATSGIPTHGFPYIVPQIVPRNAAQTHSTPSNTAAATMNPYFSQPSVSSANYPPFVFPAPFMAAAMMSNQQTQGNYFNSSALKMPYLTVTSSNSDVSSSDTLTKETEMLPNSTACDKPLVENNFLCQNGTRSGGDNRSFDEDDESHSSRDGSPEIVIRSDQLAPPVLPLTNFSSTSSTDAESQKFVTIPTNNDVNVVNYPNANDNEVVALSELSVTDEAEKFAQPNDDYVNLLCNEETKTLNINEDSYSCSPIEAEKDSTGFPEKATSDANVSDDCFEDAIEEISSTPINQECHITKKDNIKDKDEIVESTADKDDKAETFEGPTNITGTETLNTSATSDSSTKPRVWADLFRNTGTATNAKIISNTTNDCYSNVAAGEQHSPTALDINGIESEDIAMQKALEASMEANITNAGSELTNGAPFNVTKRDDMAVVGVQRDHYANKLAQLICGIQLIHKGSPFQLRGLNNCGNWCYANAVLQALVACPPFFHFLRTLTQATSRRYGGTSTPILDSLVKFVNEFASERQKTPRKPGSRDLDLGKPLDPSYVYSALGRLKAELRFKGRQEDAEEFLLAILNGIHEELIDCCNFVFGKSEVEKVNDVDAGSDWQQVGPGRKAAITREAKFENSPVSDIFVGKLRYSLHSPGAKESVSLQPFFTLPLEIQLDNIADVNAALNFFVQKETLKGFKGIKSEVEAHRRSFLEELPICLILQLKYFLYGEAGVKKIVKNIRFDIDLFIKPELLSATAAKKYRGLAKHYKLFAVVYHHGEKAEGGHYTAAIFHGGGWVLIDDTRITALNDNELNGFDPPRVPYLLFYRRCDSLQQQQQ